MGRSATSTCSGPLLGFQDSAGMGGNVWRSIGGHLCFWLRADAVDLAQIFWEILETNS